MMIKGSSIQCCLTCPEEKRHPGCHGDCQQYAEELRKYREAKEREREYYKYGKTGQAYFRESIKKKGQS